ncbi:MAG: hypothetical protein WB809_07030 [Thermoplasmata archaeon]
MTAISAPHSAREGANPFPSTATAKAHVRIPGSPRTYEVRDVLKGMGLRWDPVSHAWHGTLPAEKGAFLGRQFGLKPQVVPTIDAFAGLPPTPRATAGPRPTVTRRPLHDGSRTKAEALLALPDASADPEDKDAPVSRRFTLRDITSGLPDDSREADERAEARQLRDLRARVKAARAVVATHPGMAEVLASDWRKAAWFYARFGITEEEFRSGARLDGGEEADPAWTSIWIHNEAKPSREMGGRRGHDKSTVRARLDLFARGHGRRSVPCLRTRPRGIGTPSWGGLSTGCGSRHLHDLDAAPDHQQTGWRQCVLRQ